MTFAMFLAGVLAGAALVAVLIVPRLHAAHERRLAEVRAAADEKLALVAGNREQLAEQMKAISGDALRQVSEQMERLAAAQREADRATASGELGKRSEEIGAASTRSPAPEARQRRGRAARARPARDERPAAADVRDGERRGDPPAR